MLHRHSTWECLALVACPRLLCASKPPLEAGFIVVDMVSSHLFSFRVVQQDGQLSHISQQSPKDIPDLIFVCFSVDSRGNMESKGGMKVN